MYLLSYFKISILRIINCLYLGFENHIKILTILNLFVAMYFCRLYLYMCSCVSICRFDKTISALDLGCFQSLSLIVSFSKFIFRNIYDHCIVVSLIIVSDVSFYCIFNFSCLFYETVTL